MDVGYAEGDFGCAIGTSAYTLSKEEGMLMNLAHKSPDFEKASTIAFKKSHFSSRETSHSFNHRLTSATDSCNVSNSSFSDAKLSKALHTFKRTGEVRGRALKRLARLEIERRFVRAARHRLIYTLHVHAVFYGRLFVRRMHDNVCDFCCFRDVFGRVFGI